MNLPVATGSGRPRAPAGLVAILALFGVLGGAPSSVSSQTAEEAVVQRRLELRAAQTAFEAARSAFNVVERQFSSALADVAAARRGGSKDGLERALAFAQDRSVPYRDRESHLTEVQETVVLARENLADAIEVRLEELVEMMNAARSTLERAQLDILWRDLSLELQQVEDEAGNVMLLGPVALPEVTADPRDTQETIEAKAEILEQKAALADTLIQDKEREIGALTARLRNQRQRRDFVAGTDRFDDTRVPVVATPVAGERTPASDSTVAGRRPVTLEERIQQLRDYVEQLESYRDQLLIRAELFRQRVRAVAA